MAGETKNPSAIDEEHDGHDNDESNQKMKPLHLIKDNHNYKKQPEKDDEVVVEEEEEEEDEEGDKPTAIGDVIRVSEGPHEKNHFRAFQFNGFQFQLEDPVLLTPEDGEDETEKPSVVVIKDIFLTKDEELTVSGQRFYRPEEAMKKGGGNWQRHDPREIFYSSHVDDYSAYSVMHRCVIHLVPLPKPVPNRKTDPGFIVRKVYDHEGLRIRDLTDKECKGSLILKGRMECA